MSPIEQSTDISDSRPVNYMEYENPGADTSVVDLRKRLIEETIGGDFKFININVIGAKIFIDDLPIIGGITVLIIMTWFQFVIRREKGILFVIAEKIKQENDSHTIEFLFYETAFSEIFNSIRNIDSPHSDEFAKEREAKILKFVVRSILYAPTGLLILIVTHDFVETFLLHNFKYNGESTTLFKYLVYNGYDGQSVEIFVRLGISIVLITYSVIRTIKIVRFNKHIQEYRSVIYKQFSTLENSDNQKNQDETNRI